MPRDSGGTYSLPVGNPVISGTVIESSWANSTMGDLGNEMSDSLSRTGNGAMLAPFRAIDGSAGTPSLTFVNDPATGRALTSVGVMVDTISGVAVVEYSASGIEFLVPVTLTPIIAGDLDLALDAIIRGQKADFVYENLLTLASATDTLVLGNDAIDAEVRASAVIQEIIAGVVAGVWSATGLDITGAISATGSAAIGGNMSCDQAVAEGGFVLKDTSNVAYAALYQSADITYVGSYSINTYVTGTSVSLVHGDGSTGLYTRAGGGAVVPDTLECGALTTNGVLMTDFVINSGSNANGFFRVWNSGLRECWHTLSNVSGFGTWTYPVAFQTVPYTQLTGYLDSNTTKAAWVRIPTGTDVTVYTNSPCDVICYTKGY